MHKRCIAVDLRFSGQSVPIGFERGRESTDAVSLRLIVSRVLSVLMYWYS
jgi:hypothetical protein